MMQKCIITFDVNGIPKGQPRPRAFARAGMVRVYNPGTAEAWKGAIAMAIKPHLPEHPLEGPIELYITHFMPRPKNHYRTGENATVLKANAPIGHTGKPDIDNLTKAAMDALTHIGLWRDDNQVFHCNIKKIYADAPGAYFRIEY